MLELIPISSSLIFLGSYLFSVLRDNSFPNAIEDELKSRWQTLKRNSQLHREHPNRELQRAVYAAYCQATLQTCAALLESKGMSVDSWFRLGALPDRVSEALRSLMDKAPVGIFTSAIKQWLQKVGNAQHTRLKQLDDPSFTPPGETEDELSSAEREIESVIASDEGGAIIEALTTKILRDLSAEFGAPPEEFVELVLERWAKYFVSNFQFQVHHQPPVANAFQNRLLAEMKIDQQVWQQEFASFGGESLHRLEVAHEWLAKEQRAGFDRIEGSVDLLLPLLSFARDQVSFNSALQDFIRGEIDRGIDAADRIGDRTVSRLTNEVTQTGDRVVSQITDVLDKRLARQVESSEPERLLHTLPFDQQIESRELECDEILRAMLAPTKHVLAFAAPGGFGKTALLTKLLQKLSSDGKTPLTTTTLSTGEAIDLRLYSMLHVDGREGVKVGRLFEYAGRLVGQEQLFKDLYADPNITLPQKLFRTVPPSFGSTRPANLVCVR